MTNPVRIRGADFPSQVAAARHFGVNASTVSKAMGLAQHDGIGNGHNGIETTLDGVTYPSVSEAARALGISHSAARRRVRRVASPPRGHKGFPRGNAAQSTGGAL